MSFPRPSPHSATRPGHAVPDDLRAFVAPFVTDLDAHRHVRLTTDQAWNKLDARCPCGKAVDVPRWSSATVRAYVGQCGNCGCVFWGRVPG